MADSFSLELFPLVERFELEQFQVLFIPQTVVDGIVSVSLDIVLPKNAVVETFDVVAGAKRAKKTPVREVAQVRVNRSTSETANAEVVVDFGTPRTVSGVTVPSRFSIAGVKPWIGAAFAPRSVSPAASAGNAREVLFSEVRTERIQVEISGEGDLDSLGEEMSVVLPEAPRGLNLTINGGPAVWSHKGPAQPGGGADLSDAQWNSDSERIVHLAESLAILTGDPTNSDNVTFKLVLDSEVPGVLSLREYACSISRVSRVRFGSATDKKLSFKSEGRIQLPLSLPDPGSGQSIEVQEATLQVAGEPPEQRVLPPVGPEPAAGDGPSAPAVLAELTVDSNRAACVRLRASGLEKLEGVRLPLRAETGGAEARVVLWANKDKNTLNPVKPLDGGASDPVTLKSAPEEQWTTFTFPEAVELDEENPPWAALLVSRGEVSWSFRRKEAADPSDAEVVRRGPPRGPWKLLPALFQGADARFNSLRGRIRVVGRAPEDAPLAAMTLNLGSLAPDEVEVIPAAKGAQVRLALQRLSSSPSSLRVTSRVGAEYTLRNVDIVYKLKSAGSA